VGITGSSVTWGSGLALAGNPQARISKIASGRNILNFILHSFHQGFRLIYFSYENMK
jgi:hypothetical protein